MEEYPNWLEMPEELMANILQRTGTKEILESARKVCTTWRRICKNPEMWKVIELQRELADWALNFHNDNLRGNFRYERLTKQAVDLSCGELIGIGIRGFGTDELLDYIVQRSCKLKQLSLMRYYNIEGSAYSTGSELIWAVKRVPQLEELSISSDSINTEDIKVIGQNYPRLKSFIVYGELRGTFINCDDNAFAIANNMPELRRLKLFDKYMTNIGLMAILEGCPHLETLHIHMCYDLDLDSNLKKLCMERIKDFKFDLEIEDHDYDDYTVSSRDVDYEFSGNYSD